ncbi:integrase family protein [Gluconacetobacter diazotrophicus PA1 5]|uniref:site-specific integrase n=1 Tax=Gluconacetobacter diazotrophicus TaxID=33996 RepID=UPI000173D6D5|nr:site-specific integrase [Gluconacetobacter diazotrophicus]ACI52181.1 integrase family protein [Gluconacetobacter diazotrophicus PA1 5]TWA98224.1 phage integrase family protein [Gluconacetobacter diazotrophicus]
MGETDKSGNDPVTGKPLPKGVWYRGPGQYQARKMVDGKRLRKTFASSALARRWLSEKRAEVDLRQFKDTSAIDRLPIRQLVERYRDECMAHREADRTGHIPALLDDPVVGVMVGKWMPADVRAFRDRMLADGYAPATVVKRLNLLASIIQHAISEWDIHTVNHASGRVVKRPAGADKKRNRRLSSKTGFNVNSNKTENEQGKTEYERLIGAMLTSCHSDDVWLVRWSIEQACRLAESLSLRWKDIDFEQKTISLERVKNERHREELGDEKRPLTPGARRVLLKKLEEMPEPPSATDKLFSVGNEKAFSVRYGRLTKKAALKDLTFHDLRHEATSRLARYLSNPLDLMRVTGHRDLKSLDRYYQPILAELADKIEEQERLVGMLYEGMEQ